MTVILLILFYLFVPALILILCRNNKIINKIGAIIIAYITGLIIGNIGILPENVYNIQDTFVSVIIPLALPLLLITSNFRQWVKTSGKTVISLILGIISVILPIVSGYFLFGKHIDEANKVSGMLVGVYTGGTPNLASIATALDVKPETYIMTHTYDMAIGAVFLLIVMTFGQKFFGHILPPYKPVGIYTNEENIKNEGTDYLRAFDKINLIRTLISFGISIVIFAISFGISQLFPKESLMLVIILSITTLSLAVSFLPNIHKLHTSFDLGMYFILIFSIIVASMADIAKMNLTDIYLFSFIAMVVIGSLFIHVLLSAIFKIDVDNVLIVSTALTCSPPFVPVVAGALKNKEIIIVGIMVGIVGYAIGNYMGISMALILKGFTP